MLGLYLIMAHLLGDFVLQDRWIADEKFRSARKRMDHTTIYVLPFIPIVIFFASSWRVVTFLVLLGICHFVTDGRRFQSTLGDVIRWRFQTPEQRMEAWRHTSGAMVGMDTKYLPPNPWAPTSLMVDQALHITQLALLGGFLLQRGPQDYFL